MVMRYAEPGWTRITPYDIAGRRAVWIRLSPGRVEFCAGREGDDTYVEIPLDGTCPRETMLALEDLAHLGADLLR